MEQKHAKVGVLFVNARQRIIYMDDKLRKFLYYKFSDLPKLIGSPANLILNMNEAQYATFIHKLQNQYETTHIPLALITAQQQQLPIVADVTVNQSLHRDFLGVDYTFYTVPETAVSPILETAEFQAVDDAVHLYFKQQLRAMVMVVEVWSGANLAQHLAQMITHTAQRQGWDVRLDKEAITIGQTVKVDNLLGLLGKAATYTFKVLGKSTVVSRLKAVNNNTPALVFEAIDEHWFDKI